MRRQAHGFDNTRQPQQGDRPWQLVPISGTCRGNCEDDGEYTAGYGWPRKQRLPPIRATGPRWSEEASITERISSRRPRRVISAARRIYEMGHAGPCWPATLGLSA